MGYIFYIFYKPVDPYMLVDETVSAFGPAAGVEWIRFRRWAASAEDPNWRQNFAPGDTNAHAGAVRYLNISAIRRALWN